MAGSNDGFEGLEPSAVWAHFAELTRIPRPSKEEALATAHVRDWAGRRGLEAQQDDAGNTLVRVSATQGRERAPTVVLQSHLDMVCERDPESPFDPREGRIHVVREDDWLLAEGTTLGADNGIGVAVAMAVAEDVEVEHGPLELLFTVSEEQGLDGAKGLDASLVTGRLLVNLDGTSDESLTVGCAGSDHTFLRVELPRTAGTPGHAMFRLELSGAKGGHSGGDIAAGRTNAIKALGQVLSAAFDVAPFGLASLEGGVSRNAIPRDAHALLAVENDGVSALEAAALDQLSSIVRRHAGSDADVRLAITPAAETGTTDRDTTRRVLDLIAAIPTGVVAMTPDLAGVVETSTSLTVARTESGVLTLASMARSANAAALDELRDRMKALSRLARAEIEVRRSYPPWEPQLDSPLLTVAGSAFERLFGSEPGLAVVHGGLECAVLGQKLDGVQMISVGPEIVGPHAPGERVRISSVQRSYRFLRGLLADLSRSDG